MLEQIATHIEESIFGGPTWATRSIHFSQRLRFFRDTGEWPGIHCKVTTALALQSDIDAERADGKDFCARQKFARGREAGLDIR